jgi:hypothetical protein
MNLKRAVVVFGLSLLLSAAAMADTTASLSFVSPVGPGDYQFNYYITLGTTDELNPAAITGANCTTGSGTVPCAPSDTFFTIYDVPGLLTSPFDAEPSTGSNVGWGFVVQPVGVTPVTGGGTDVNPPTGDSGTLENVTFYYTGSTVFCGGNSITDPGCVGTYQSTFFGFSLQSSDSSTQTGSFTSSVTDTASADVGILGIDAVDYGSGNVLVPAGSSVPTPEPVGIWLLALGLIAVIFYDFPRRMNDRRVAK